LVQNSGALVQVPNASAKKQVPGVCWQNWPLGHRRPANPPHCLPATAAPALAVEIINVTAANETISPFLMIASPVAVGCSNQRLHAVRMWCNDCCAWHRAAASHEIALLIRSVLTSLCPKSA
jgi:hypothetical protein